MKKLLATLFLISLFGCEIQGYQIDKCLSFCKEQGATDIHKMSNGNFASTVKCICNNGALVSISSTWTVRIPTEEK